MEGAGNNNNDIFPSGDDRHVHFRSGSNSPAIHAKSSPIMAAGDGCEFAPFLPSGKQKQQTRSLTSAEIKAVTVTEEELDATLTRLQTEPAPLGLQEAIQKERERRASIKEERKRSIDFIRSRTNSRAAASGRPSTDTLTDNTNGRPNLNILTEGQQAENGGRSALDVVREGQAK